MTISAAASLMSVGLACYVAALSRRFSRAPGWHDQRYFSLASLAVAAYSALNIPTELGYSDRAVVWSSRAQLAFAAFHAIAWLRYSRKHLSLPQTPAERVLIALLAVAGSVGGLTSASYPGAVVTHRVESLALTYRDPVPTVFGDLAIALVIGALAVPAWRFFGGWRRGVAHAGVQCVALALLLLLGVNDGLVVTGVSPLPYLVNVGFLIPVAAVAYALTARFVEDARRHDELREHLEAEVQQRTAELTSAKDALHQAEKLAALGQFAAGVAHEVNNPAAVVNANLAYLSQNEAEDLSKDGRDALDDSIVAMRRIGAIVRQLLEAGRLAASTQKPHPVHLHAIAEEAVRTARVRLGGRVRVVNTVPIGAHALGDENVLLQVLGNLVVNAIQAIPEHRANGHVILRSERHGARVRIVVEDNGPGMPTEVLRRVFDPFFTTKPFGVGTGLGLAVSRGLVTGLGGEIRLESEPEKGTRATVELGVAAQPVLQTANEPQRATGAPLRLLLIDDEPAVRTSVGRMLEPGYRVVLASGVAEALALLASGERFDLVLCDVMMAGGGGEQLYRELASRSASLARRLVFFTGGATTAEAQRFLREQNQPVLYKPLDPEQLSQIAERITTAA